MENYVFYDKEKCDGMTLNQVQEEFKRPLPLEIRKSVSLTRT